MEKNFSFLFVVYKRSRSYLLVNGLTIPNFNLQEENVYYISKDSLQVILRNQQQLKIVEQRDFQLEPNRNSLSLSLSHLFNLFRCKNENNSRFIEASEKRNTNKKRTSEKEPIKSIILLSNGNIKLERKSLVCINFLLQKAALPF